MLKTENTLPPLFSRSIYILFYWLLLVAARGGPHNNIILLVIIRNHDVLTEIYFFESSQWNHVEKDDNPFIS